ncbi:4-amino-4-deoxy-L-arabinose transferase [Cohaesibacter sp. ES.047]|uniref:ArnT family glycosyltransferase n=1 Tax=Cohaesibacter sp. ES.047 TaxID=1798205 RepID=UPI000BB964B2|nr:glycosyltransferase family 39 protein [Cohaesibacter sp. ES.047]SNY93483.1 4-amino-4-deoxy-L-arabinose transferase [Cohaesibacter sp. ES.047]
MSDLGQFPQDPNRPEGHPMPNTKTGAHWHQSGDRHPVEPDWITSLSDAIQNGLNSLCSSRIRSFLALMLFALVCFLPGFNSIPPVDRDEARFAQASKQMMEAGDYVDIRFQDGTRYKKPVGIYWLQVLSAKATGQGENAPIWAYRIPSLVGALLSVGLTFLIGMRMASVRVGFLAGLGMAAAILLGVEARLAKTDAMLLATILAVQWLLWELYDQRSGLKRWQGILLWASLGVAVLIKGPIILMVSGLTILFVTLQERSIGWLRGTGWKIGIPLFLVITLPWFIAIGIHTDWGFYLESVGKDMIGKVASGKESHGAPPGTYLAATIGTFWPVSVFLILSVVWIWKQKKLKSVRFALSWIVPTWILFELVPTKLPHYILPVLPALAILTAAALENLATIWRPLWARIVALLIPIISIVLGLGAPIALIVLEGAINPAAFGLGLVASGLGLLCYAVFIRGRVMAAFILAATVAPILYLSIHGTIFPSFRSVWLSNQLEETVNRVKPCESVEVASAGYSEPSLVFLLGTDTQFRGGQSAAKFLTEAGCRIAIVERHEEKGFFEVIDKQQAQIEEIARVDGYKLNGGKWQSFGLYRLKM